MTMPSTLAASFASPPAPPGASVLFVFPWCLDRVGHGNIQRVLALARYLAARDVAVDLVYQGNPGVPAAEEQVAFCRRVIRVDAWRSSDDGAVTNAFADYYSGFEPPPANLSPGTALTSAVRGLLDAIDYTAVISTYAWTAPIFEPLARRALRIVDLQDILSLHGERSRQATGETSPFSLAAETERFLWRQWDVLLAITVEEADVVGPALRPSQHLLTVGHAVPVPERPMLEEPPPDTVVYAGSDNPANQRAMRWLLTEVWPQVLMARPHARLRVVGLICDAIRGTSLASTPNVDLVGFTSDPADELARATVAVAPYLYGSGLKIKVLEAAACGRPIVTTPHGAEGTGLVNDEHAVVADTAGDFARGIVSVLEDPGLAARLAAAARNEVRRAFSEDACYGRTLELIMAHAASPLRPGVIPTSIEDRLRAALSMRGDATVVVWGNGSHTRSLIPVLQRLGAAVRVIADSSATRPGTSAEGIAVIPAAAFRPQPGDLVVLSSQTYESEMWTDLAPLRSLGLDVLGLYRRELVTDGLGRALARSTRKATHAGAPIARALGGRLVIVEPSAGRSRGPFLRLARTLAGAAISEGMHVLVAGARRVQLENLEPADFALLEFGFELAHWDMLRETGGDLWGRVTRFARIMASDLTALADRTSLAARDVVLFHTANLVDVLAAVMWLTTMPATRIPAIRLLFHFTAAQEAQWLQTTEPELRHAYSLALALLEERAGHRLVLLAQNEVLAPVLSDAFERAVQPIGFPVVPPHPAATTAHRGPLRVLFAGEARADKGFGLLPGVADALAPELESGQLRLVCQTSQNEFADDTIRAAITSLGSRTGLELVGGFLSSDGYDELMAGCDLVLMPYDAGQYRSRLSAVFVDATRLGIPVVVPDGTWMSRQLADGLGAGVTFHALTARAVANAVRLAAVSGPLSARAREAMPRVWRRHSPHAVLATIVGRPSAPSLTPPVPPTALQPTMEITHVAAQ